MSLGINKTMKRSVLVTGFEPFGGDLLNPSEVIAVALEGRVISKHVIHAQVLPCVFGTSIDVLNDALNRYKPNLVICLGQAGGRAGITPERVAINIDDARIADNDANKPIDRPIVKGGPVAYFSTLPIKAITAALNKQKIVSSVSQTAGTFVCNHIFYALMHAITKTRSVRGGFVHVPWLPEQIKDKKGQPSMPIEVMIKGIETVIKVSLKTAKDKLVSAGAEH